ncbi:hypothetical protein [Pseudomonas sp. R5(2019)]|uniref:hypothetical protein n=1 Tax=Pseudomonas sp. R5(2019) TaxID=2697566 RepID=UPI001412EE50|nr:hypothetical protein [Pseudomonas sp. R5(2019)]NBA94269.1 hypothetical protein [Pseudomonas sp. R5(2019)]
MALRQAFEAVAERVCKGGWKIPATALRRGFEGGSRSLKNLFFDRLFGVIFSLKNT